MAVNLTTYGDDTLEALRVAVIVEQGRRSIVANAAGRADSDSRTYLDAVGQVTGAEWKQPTAAFDAYPLGWAVTDKGKKFESLIAGNPHEPPTNWREVTEPGGPPPAWVQPTGSEDSYNTGDEVTFEGAVYKSTIDANTWSPTDYPAGWEKIT